MLQVPSSWPTSYPNSELTMSFFCHANLMVSLNLVSYTKFSAIADLVMSSLVSPVVTPDRLVMEHMLMMAILHANVGTEVLSPLFILMIIIFILFVSDLIIRIWFYHHHYYYYNIIIY